MSEEVRLEDATTRLERREGEQGGRMKEGEAGVSV